MPKIKKIYRVILEKNASQRDGKMDKRERFYRTSFGRVSGLKFKYLNTLKICKGPVNPFQFFDAWTIEISTRPKKNLLQ